MEELLGWSKCGKSTVRAYSVDRWPELGPSRNKDGPIYPLCMLKAGYRA
jgi:hypothetical protein